MQFFVLNATLTALFAVGLALVAYYKEAPELRRLTPAIILLSYALGAWAFTYYRIFDVREVLLSLGQRLGMIVILGFGIVHCTKWLAPLMPFACAVVLSGCGVGMVVVLADDWTRQLLGLSSENVLTAMRAAIIDKARNEPHPEKLTEEFEAFLRVLCNTQFAALLCDQGAFIEGGGMRISKARPCCDALGELGWATPESLLRRRPTSESLDLREFLDEHSLGLLVASPRGSKTPTLLIALGVKENEWPFTYPEVERLQNVAELMDNILTRSRLTMQSALRAKVEHLAMMSGGLAHDLKNLITPVSSFLVHTDGQFVPGTIEHEVHAAAMNSVRTMADYVREALFFSSRLTPKLELVALERLFSDVRAVTAARAEANGVAVAGEPSFSGSVMVDRVLIQRVLVNLVHNSIDASKAGDAVTLTATAPRSGWLRLEVIDSGCGIAPEVAGRIFDPYFTTKQVGEELRGFGLGLTISQKIVQLHNGNITLRSPPGGGTVISVDLPIASSN